MNEDNTLYLSLSTGWKVKESTPEVRTGRDRTGITRETLVFDVYHDDEHEIVTNHPEYGTDLYVHERRCIELKHACMFTSDVVLRVHYCSYVTKGKRRRRCVDVMPFRCDNNYYTNHFKESIERAMTSYGLTVKHCASIFNTTPLIVKTIDKQRLMKKAGDMRPPKGRTIKHLAVDEFLLHHGHRYCTIVIDADSGELLYLEPGKRAAQLKHFFKWIGDGFMKNVEAISMDMNTNYSSAVKKEYPHIKITYDLFHLMKLFNDKVVTGIRRQQARKMKEEMDLAKENRDWDLYEELRIAKKDLFNGRMLLLANKDTLKARDAMNKELNRKAIKEAEADNKDVTKLKLRKEDSEERLATILKTNSVIQNVCRLREKLQDLMELQEPHALKTMLRSWMTEARELHINQLTRFVKTVDERFEGIITRAEFHISSGRMEGVNGFIKGLRRSAFGYQDFDYFSYLIWEQCDDMRKRYEKRKKKGWVPSNKRDYKEQPLRKYEKRLKKTVFNWEKHPAPDAPPSRKEA